MSRSLGVVIPAYRPDVDALVAYVRAIDGRLDPDAIRVEIDEPTPEALEALAGLPAAVNAADRRRGKGAAITDGFERLGTDVLAFADADGSTPADSLADVIAPVLAGEADIAAGSRRHPESDVRAHQTYARRWLGNGFVWLARRFLEEKLHDYQCGAKAIDREAWRAVRGHLYEPGFAWDIELIAIAAALDLRIVEVPITWVDRPGSTVDPIGASFEFARALLSARHRAKLLRDHPLHSAIETYREGEPALVDRRAGDDD